MLLHRHRFPSLWSPTLVPTEPVEVDWSHPLSNQLASLYVLGAPNGGLRELTGLGTSLTLQSAATVPGTTPVGNGILHGVASSGLIGAQAVAALNISTPQTLVWYGVLASATVFNSTCLVGVVYDKIASAPFYSRVITMEGNNGGSINISDSTASTALFTTPLGRLHCIIGTFDTNMSLYIDNVSVVTPVAVGTPSYSANSVVAFGCEPGTTNFSGCTTLMGAWLNRSLSRSEIAWISAEPFSMLRPVARRVYRAVTPAADPRPAVMNAQTVGASYQPLPSVTPLRTFAPPAPPVAPALDQRRLLNLWQALGTYQPAAVPLVLRQFLPQFGTAPAAGPAFDPRQLQNLLRAIGTYQLDPQVIRGPTFAPPAPPVAPLFNQRQMTTLAQVASATWMPDPTVPAFLRFRNYPPTGIVPPPLVSGRPVVIWMD